MAADTTDLSNKRFIVCIDEIQQNFVFGDEFSGRYSRTVTLSNGTSRTIELTPTVRDGRCVVELKDTGGLTYMGLNGTHINGQLLVQIRAMDALPAPDRADEGRSRETIVLPPGTSLLSLEGFTPPGFVHGIEILNDNTTPMAFMVEVLEKFAGLDEASSTGAMLDIHRKGGALLPLESREFANRVAAAIASEAQRHDHELTCRAVSV
jgi:ATP-dependent Clp protease adapter protein ClpS